MFGINPQRGAGPLPREFPSTLSSLRIWLRGDSLKYLADSEIVPEWIDESGYNNTFQQMSIGACPTVSATRLNGHWGVNFSNQFIGNFYQSAGLGPNGMGDAITGYIVFHNNSAQPTGMWDSSPQQANTFDNELLGGVGTVNWWNNDPSLSLGITTAGDHLVYFQAYFTSGGTVRNIDAWRDTTSLGNVQSSNSNSINWRFMTIGAINQNTQWFDGIIYEQVWFNSVLGSTDRDAVASYLRTKYGL